GEDTVGIALDELDDFLEDCIDLRKQQLNVFARVQDFGYDWTQKHAGSVSAEASAEASHKESMETIRRVNAKEAELIAARKSEIEAKQAAEALIITERTKAYTVLADHVKSMELLTDEEIVSKLSSITDIDTLRYM